MTRPGTRALRRAAVGSALVAAAFGGGSLAPASASSLTTRHQDRSVEVRSGDTLWSVVRHAVGPTAPPAEIARLVPALYRANRSTIGSDPNRILPGQRLVVPGPSTFPAASGGLFGDLDGDGHSDIFHTTWQKGRKDSRWMKHTSTGRSFTTTTGTFAKSYTGSLLKLVEGRLDSDRRSEIYGYDTLSSSRTVRLRPASKGSPQLSLRLPKGDSLVGIVAGNFDGAGHDDLAVFARRSGATEVLVYRNTGTATPRFSEPPVLWGAVPDMGSTVAVGDFNADGRDDLVTYRPGSLHQPKKPVQRSTLQLLTSTGNDFAVSPDVLYVDDEGQSAVVALRSTAAPSTLLLVDTWDPVQPVRRVPITGASLAPPQRWAAGAKPPRGVFKVSGGGPVTSGDFNGDGYEDLAETTSVYASGKPDLHPIFVWLGHGATGSAPSAWFDGNTKTRVAGMASRGIPDPG